MRSEKNVQFRMLSWLYRILLICLVVLGLVFISGTIYGVFFNVVPSTLNLQANGSLNNEKGQTITAITKNEQTFTGIGRIRVSTADPQPGMVILSITFVYYPADKDFSEELALRIGDFRYIVVDFISSFSIKELHELSEETLKAQLLHRFNAVLRLGQIEALFLSDFLIIG